MLYFDTSALLPYYRHEARSESVQALLARQREPVVVSHLGRVEFASALARWVRTGELDERQANRIEAAFREDLGLGRLALRPMDPGHYDQAERWLLMRKTSLRTLDALHLACADGLAAPLVSLDAALLEAAHFLAVRTAPLDEAG